MQLVDRLPFLGLKKTDAGFVVARARLSRTGIQEYRAGDPSLGGTFADRDPSSIVRIYRPADEVFAPEAVATYAGLPITIEHRGGFVTPDNARDLVVGWVGDDVVRDGEHVVGTVRLTHRAGIDALERGIEELSVGYATEIMVEPGMTPDGQSYDAVQRMIRANHVSLVSKGRCGPTCRISRQAHDAGDCSGSCSCEKGRQMATKLIDVNGIQIEMPEQAAQAFDALRGAHAKAIEAKDAEIAALADKAKAQDTALAKAEARAETAEKALKDAEAKLSPTALDAAARERATLVEDAKLLAPKLETKTIDSAAIRREALKAAGVALDGKSDDYIAAAFDARVESARANGGTAKKGAEALATRTQANDADDARSKYLAARSSAYKLEAQS